MIYINFFLFGVESLLIGKTNKSGFSLGTNFELLNDFRFGIGNSNYYEKIDTDSTASAKQKSQEGNYWDSFINLSFDNDTRNQKFQTTDGFRSQYFIDLPVISETGTLSNTYLFKYFTELYEKTGVDTTMTLQLTGNSLISTTTNTDIIIDPNGEGEIFLFGQEDFKISNSSRDSTTANHNITLSNEYADADIIFAVNTGSTTTEVARFDGSASALLMASGKQIQLGGTSTAISGNNSNITMTGNVTITGNLETAGTRTEISSTILDVEDNIIVLNKKKS